MPLPFYPVRTLFFFLTSVNSLLVVANATDQLDVPKVFTTKDFSSADLARSANKYIAMGEKKAVQSLKKLALETRASKQGMQINTRITWICRMIFEAKEKPIRRPLVGALMIPINGNDAARWPLFPLAKSGETFFVLGQAGFGTGIPEGADKYIEYCQHNGKFRKAPLTIPEQQRAQKDLKKLKDSKRWQEINWKTANPKATEAWFWKSIAEQARSIQP